MSLYQVVKTRMRVDYELSEEIEAKVGICAVTLFSCSGGRCWHIIY